MADAPTLALETAPSLTYRSLYQELRSYAAQSMNDDDAETFVESLEAAIGSLVAPLSFDPPQAQERSALQQNRVTVKGKSVDVPSRVQEAIIQLSDEWQYNEKKSCELWLLASDAGRRQWLERVDQLGDGAIAEDIPAAARHILVSELEYKLLIVKDLLKLRLETTLPVDRLEFITTFSNKLLDQGLLTNLLSSYENQLPKLVQTASAKKLASYWHALIADCVVLIASSYKVTPQETVSLGKSLHKLSDRLGASVAKVSPHILNLSSFSQLSDSTSVAGASPKNDIELVSYTLRALASLQVALLQVLLPDGEKTDRNTGNRVSGRVLFDSDHSSTVADLHVVFHKEEWEQSNFQSVARLCWAAFLGASTGNSLSDNSCFTEADEAPRIVKKAIKDRAFSTLTDVFLKHLPDRDRDPVLFAMHERSLELLFVKYSSKLVTNVPTVADRSAMSEDDEDKSGDCLENLMDYAIALCSLDSSFARAFWRVEDMTSQRSDMEEVSSTDDSSFVGVEGYSGRCHNFLIICRDAAHENPACLPSYMELVAAAARGPDCAQLAFQHVKQNPTILCWDHYFAVMIKYQRLLTDAEKPQEFGDLSGALTAHATSNPGQKFIRPKELEALQAIQAVIQAVVADHQLALIFFHNHDWVPVPTFVSLLQCRIPSALKGSLMKTLAVFARVPEIAPFLWKHVDALQILRTSADVSIYGREDLSYELEHYESASRTYPATKGFLALLTELFASPHAWRAFEGDGKVAAIQVYFEFLVDRIFLQFDQRKYDFEEEKWALASRALSIFKQVLRNGDNSTDESSLSHQLLARILSSSPLLTKLLLILSSDAGAEGLENTSLEVHLEHAFVYCLDIVKKTTEATYGALNYAGHVPSRRRAKHRLETTTVGLLRERCVQHAMEIMVLVLENDQKFVNWDLCRQPSHRLQVELLHSILCRYRSDFVNMAMYIQYTKSSYIPHLSAVIMRMVSSRLTGQELVDLLVDSGAATPIVLGYMQRLLSADDDSIEVDEQLGKGRAASVDSLDAGDITIPSTRKRKRLDPATSSAQFELSERRTPRPSVRSAILDLLLDNLNRSAPNVAHLLLGVLHMRSNQDGGYIKSGLDAIITLVSNADFVLEYPELAERCYHVLYLLLASEFSSEVVTTVLESRAYDYFACQMELFSALMRIGRRRSPSEVIASLNMRGWFLKGLAVYLHVGLLKRAPVTPSMASVLELLFEKEGEKTLISRLLDESAFEFFPPDVPEDKQVVSIAEKAAGEVTRGYYKWLRIDVETFCRELQAMEASAPNALDFLPASSAKRMRSGVSQSAVGSSNVEQLLRWAVHWNLYSERVAAESHALRALGDLAEVLVVDYLSPSNEQRTMVQADVRGELLFGFVSTLLQKLTTKAGISAQLFEIAARITLTMLFEMRQPPQEDAETRDQKLVDTLERVFRAICNAHTAAGNPVAARHARAMLYTCVMNVLHMLPASQTSDSFELLAPGAPAVGKRLNALSTQVVDQICRDASDGDDPLSMALAISSLESIASFEQGAVVLRSLREKGFLAHFVDVFQRLCELDAELAKEDAGEGRDNVLPPGVDSSTVGTMYECFLSLFSRVAASKEGARILLESNLLRVLTNAKNLPTHRPRLHAPQLEETSRATFQRLEAMYSRKWLPVLRLLSAMGSSLPQHRAFADQTLHLISSRRKLFAGALKLEEGTPQSLELLREISYVTFVLRYVGQFDDLCVQVLPETKWERLAQSVLHVLLFYGSEPLPVDQDMRDDDGVWWLKVHPANALEQQASRAHRFSCPDCVQILSDGNAQDSASLLELSAFDEDKVYASRMIVCNAAAFCANRVMRVLDEGEGSSPLMSLSTSARNDEWSIPSLASRDLQAFESATTPLWRQSPTLDAATARLQMFTTALESGQLLLDRLAAGRGCAKHERSDKLLAWRNIVEYHTDSMTFAIENLSIVLMLHFAHYVPGLEKDKVHAVQHPLADALRTLKPHEGNKFLHAIARRLRELLASTRS